MRRQIATSIIGTMATSSCGTISRCSMGDPIRQIPGKRRLRRVAVADKTFFQLCPQFSIEDPRIIAWGFGATLMVD